MTSLDFPPPDFPTPDEPAGDSDEADLRVGRRIRALRLERKLGLTELAQKVGISVGALSQIERGISSLRVRTLWPLAAALEVDPHSLIQDGQDDSGDLYSVRATARKRVPVGSEGVVKELLSPAGAALTGLLVRVDPGCGSADAYAHAGHEFGLITSGEIDLTIDSVVYRLKTGDSFAFKSTLPHSFRNPGAVACEILWVNTVRPAEVRNGP